MEDLIVVLLEFFVELLCMGTAGRTILLVLLAVAGFGGFCYWAYLC